MKIYEEEYVSFEIAKLLCEKGFDWNTEKSYVNDNTDRPKCSVGERLDVTNYDLRLIPCPSQTLAMKWLREVHRLHIYVFYITPDEKYKYTPWVFEISKMDEDYTYSLHRGDSYEEATEIAIKYALENMI